MKNAFFCEACGAEVKGRSDTCPSCGRSFLGIRCPRCGKEGSADVFKGGCPDCGYLAESEEDTVPWPEKRHYRVKPDWPASRYWSLSALVVIGVGLILYFWLH